MIKLFRNIRRGMLNELKFRNYLVYALGEIILVVIGILIALAINNSYQNSVLEHKEQTYLTGLEEEFRISKIKLDELIQVNRRNFEGALQIIEITTDKVEHPTEKKFSELLYNTLSNDISYNPNNAILIEMINSGSLKDLSNTTLKIHLTNWLATLEDIAKQETELRNQRVNILNMLSTDEFSIRTIIDQAGVSTELGLPVATSDISNLDLLNKPAFENNLLTFILSTHATEEAHYKPLMQDINYILELIAKEI